MRKAGHNLLQDISVCDWRELRRAVRRTCKGFAAVEPSLPSSRGDRR